jgi:pyruvate formate lyase activating enzyme
MSGKGIVFDIQRASLHDGPGIRTTIFLKGCPLSCLWCHNPEAVSFGRQLFFYYDKCVLCATCSSICEEDVHHLENGSHGIDYEKCTLCGKCVEECNHRALKIVGVEMSVDQVMDEVLADRAFYANSGGGMTLSGGEPLSQFSFSLELLIRSRGEGIHTCIETSGFVLAAKFRQILPYIDILLFDYKITGSEVHIKYTGVSDTLILSNLDWAYHTGVPIILRCPIIPGVNDDQQHFAGIRALDQKYPNLKGIEILPYHDMGNSKRISIGMEKTLPTIKSTPSDTVNEWLDQIRSLGCEKVSL